MALQSSPDKLTGAGAALMGERYRSHPSRHVKDVVGTVQFYVHVLGFEIARDFYQPPYSAVVTRFGRRISFAVGRADQELHALLCVVDDATALFDQVTKAGAKQVAPLQRSGSGWLEFEVVDSDGHRVRFVEVGGTAGIEADA